MGEVNPAPAAVAAVGGEEWCSVFNPPPDPAVAAAASAVTTSFTPSLASATAPDSMIAATREMADSGEAAGAGAGAGVGAGGGGGGAGGGGAVSLLMVLDSRDFVESMASSNSATASLALLSAACMISWRMEAAEETLLLLLLPTPEADWGEGGVAPAAAEEGVGGRLKMAEVERSWKVEEEEDEEVGVARCATEVLVVEANDEAKEEEGREKGPNPPNPTPPFFPPARRDTTEFARASAACTASKADTVEGGTVGAGAEAKAAPVTVGI